MRSLVFAILVVFAIVGMVAMSDVAETSLKVVQDPMGRERVGMFRLHVGRRTVGTVHIAAAHRVSIPIRVGKLGVTRAGLGLFAILLRDDLVLVLEILAPAVVEKRLACGTIDRLPTFAD